MSEALRLAAVLEDEKMHSMAIDTAAAAELRRLHAENEALKVELHEQARVNGMGGEREASLMAELERKSDAIQRLWKERDELRALNAELVEALRPAVNAWFRPHGINYVDFKPYMEAARAALARVEASK